jgi:hypothetical protein
LKARVKCLKCRRCILKIFRIPVVWYYIHVTVVLAIYWNDPGQSFSYNLFQKNIRFESELGYQVILLTDIRNFESPTYRPLSSDLIQTVRNLQFSIF